METPSRGPRPDHVSGGRARQGRARRDAPPSLHRPKRWRGGAGSRSKRTTETRSSGNGETAPGVKPVASRTSSGRAIVTRRASTRRATFPVSALRSPGTSAMTGIPSHTSTSDLTICPSVQPIASAARLRRGGRGRQLLKPRLGAGLAEKAGDALDRLRPLHDATHPSSTKRTSSKPTLCNAAMSSSVADVSIEKTISASPPSRFRETAMFAMFTPASPNIEPTRPITPG